MEIAEYDGVSTSLLARYVYGPGMTAPVAKIDPAGLREYLHADAIGSVVSVTSAPPGSGAGASVQVLNPVSGTPAIGSNVTIAGYTVPAGDNRVLVVAVGNEGGAIDGVTFGGQVLTEVHQVANGGAKRGHAAA